MYLDDVRANTMTRRALYQQNGHLVTLQLFNDCWVVTTNQNSGSKNAHRCSETVQVGVAETCTDVRERVECVNPTKIFECCDLVFTYPTIGTFFSRPFPRCSPCLVHVVTSVRDVKASVWCASTAREFSRIAGLANTQEPHTLLFS
jgi:hypothetical protein